MITDKNISITTINLSLNELDTYDFPLDELFALEVVYKNTKFCLLINFSSTNEKLICFGPGALIRNRRNSKGDLIEPPYFSRWSWYKYFEESVISYADPTLFKDEKIYTGWFVGEKDHWYLETLSLIISKLSENRKIKNENILFFGSSAGGFVSIGLGTLIKNSKVIINNSQFILKNSPKTPLYPLFSLLKESFDKLTTKEIRELIEYRLDVVKLFDKENYYPPIEYYVNSKSQYDIQEQLIPMLKSLSNLDLFDGNFNIHIYETNSADPHNAMDTDVTIDIIKKNLRSKPLKTQITLKTGTKNNTKTITGQLTDINNKIIPDATIKLLINNGRATVKTDNKGTFTYIVNKPRIGTNQITAQYNGSKKYQQSQNITTFESKPLKTQITLKTGTKNNTKTITGQLTDINNKIIPDATIKLLINNGRATVKTDEDGHFSYVISNPRVGLNQVHVFYGGNASYLESSDVVSFEILPLDTSILLDSVSDVKKGDAVELSGKLVDENGNPLLGANVKLQINNGRASVRTNNEGIFKYLFNNPKDGINNVLAVFNGSKNYRPDSNMISFMVLALDTEIVLDRVDSVKMGNPVEISGKLIDENRDAVSGAQIKLLINNGRASLKTDEDGHFSYVISNPRIGLNQINVLFEGNKSYLKSNAVVSFETLPLDCKIHLDTIKNVKISDAVEITGNLLDENRKIIPNAVVKLLINKGRTTTKTDDYGYFRYVVNNPRIGLNYITASYNSKYFKENSEMISFEVLTLDTNIELDKINDAKKGEVVEISGKLFDEKHDIIPNAPLKLFINTGRVTTRTNDDGIFKYDYKTSRTGRNNVMIFFLGSKKHNPLNISSQFTVHDKKQ